MWSFLALRCWEPAKTTRTPEKFKVVQKVTPKVTFGAFSKVTHLWPEKWGVPGTNSGRPRDTWDIWAWFMCRSDILKETECPRDRRDISRDRWDVSPGQTGRTPGAVPPKFFMFIGFFLSPLLIRKKSVLSHFLGSKMSRHDQVIAWCLSTALCIALMLPLGSRVHGKSERICQTSFYLPRHPALPVHFSRWTTQKSHFWR